MSFRSIQEDPNISITRNLPSSNTDGPITTITNSNTSDDQYALKVKSSVGSTVINRKLVHLEGETAGGVVGHINFGDEAYQGVLNSNFYFSTNGVSHFANASWAEKATINNETGEIYTALGVALNDGVTAPTTAAGKAYIYVDSADGDLKVKFGDGTIKTLATDT